MSEHAEPQKPLDELFQATEIEQFDQDDVQAGRAIGKMLSFFFLYTIIAMAISAWWTLRSLAE